MRMTVFAKRNAKEILRDPLTLFFGAAFPVILLVLLWMIGRNIPDGMGPSTFRIGLLAPGIALFGLTFITLFSAMLVSKDRSDSLMLRLMTSPMTASDFVLGYTLPLLPIAIIQIFIVFIASIPLGLRLTTSVLISVTTLIPAAVLFIGIGLLFGTILSEKQVGGICGALMTNLCAWLSGIWFDVSAVGKWFETIAKALPFIHAVDAARAAASGDYSAVMPDLICVIIYAVVVSVAAIWLFSHKIKSKNI